ncbi:hypothetical protein N9I15_03335 [Flavobacteriaceae bacterium]|jgi:hypothetical protein|nr:hypothetical protein [Flavobacteriaceae bacterium]
MKKNDVYKKIVLGILFVFPLLVYLFFASGKNNFAKLPILTSTIEVLPQNLIGDSPQLKDHITILGYWGGSLENKKAEALNLNEKIYKRFYQFDDFQFVFLVDSSRVTQVKELKNELKEGVGTDLSRWNFIYTSKEEINTHFASLKTPFSLDENQSAPFVFIIDKDRNLRGRNDDEDTGTLYGFDARSVAQINKKMIDDVKVILAEYRLALKIYNTQRNK